MEFLKQLLELARALVGAERAEADGSLDTFQVLDPDRGALTQILEEFAPPGVPVIVEHVVDEIDAIVKPVRGSRWQESQPGDREVRKQLRLVLKNNGLPPTGELFDRAYAYIREHCSVDPRSPPGDVVTGCYRVMLGAGSALRGRSACGAGSSVPTSGSHEDLSDGPAGPVGTSSTRSSSPSGSPQHPGKTEDRGGALRAAS